VSDLVTTLKHQLIKIIFGEDDDIAKVGDFIMLELLATTPPTTTTTTTTPATT